MNGQIFISYRREESRWSARSLHYRLCRDFNPQQIFMDIDAIALGEDFVQVIDTTANANADPDTQTNADPDTHTNADPRVSADRNIRKGSEAHHGWHQDEKGCSRA
jgi:hypothetical protein